MVYIESYDETMVRRVVDGMSLFLSAYRNAFHLIPIEDRTMLLDRVDHVNRPLPLNAFVRMKKGLYKGDLAQVVRLSEDDQKVPVFAPSQIGRRATRPAVGPLRVHRWEFLRSEGSTAAETVRPDETPGGSCGAQK